MTTTMEHRVVGYVWYWIIVVSDANGLVLAKVMDCDYHKAVKVVSDELGIQVED